MRGRRGLGTRSPGVDDAALGEVGADARGEDDAGASGGVWEAPLRASAGDDDPSASASAAFSRPWTSESFTGPGAAAVPRPADDAGSAEAPGEAGAGLGAAS